MLIKNIRSGDSPSSRDSVRLSADVSYDDRPGASESLWFEVPNWMRTYCATSAAPWLVAMLPLASKLDEALRIEGSIDPVLLESSRELMEWWRYWFPEMNIVRVSCDGIVSEADERPQCTAQFFSGGVDSFFTLLRHAEPEDPIQVNDLLVGWGFDIPLSDADAFARVSSNLRSAADRLGKRLVPFATNIRQTRFGGLPWGTIGHGCAMASVALALERAYRRVLIPSTDGYRETGPWGSHATTDHLFSTSGLRVVHDGAAYSRFQKVALAATSPVALATLRVCWRSESDTNCGTCEKCLRTMIGLDLCDVLHEARTFASARADLASIRRVHCPRTAQGSMQLYYLEMRDEARKRGRDDLADAISHALRYSTLRQPLLAGARRLRQVQRVAVLGRLGQALDVRLQRSLIT